METKAFLGIDIGGTNVKIGAITLEGTLLDQRSIATNTQRPAEQVIEAIAETALEVRKKVETDGRAVRSVGVGVPGSIDWEQGICHLLPNFPNGWRNVRLKAQLEALVNLPTFVINDVRAITLAEKMFGAGRTVSSMVMVAIGTGIGGGIILDNELVMGKNGNAGEIGHITVEPGGIACGCGGRGCLERYASGPAIAGAAIMALAHKHDTIIRNLVDNDYNKVTAAVVSQAAEHGDRIAKQILSDAGKYLGRVIAQIVTVVEPEMVVLAGGVAQAGHLLFDSVYETFRSTLFIIRPETVQLRLSELGFFAGIQGCAAWGLKKISK